MALTEGEQAIIAKLDDILVQVRKSRRIQKQLAPLVNEDANV